MGRGTIWLEAEGGEVASVAVAVIDVGFPSLEVGPPGETET
jgi:hypothetical protein